MKALWPLALIAFALPIGCSIDDSPPLPPPPPVPQRTAPLLDPLTIADWPPMGPNGTITLHCTDDQLVSTVTAAFKNTASRPGTGSNTTVSFTGRELGEGMGTFVARCCDGSATCAERTIRDFFVDLTPPEIEEDRSIASPTGEGLDGQISIWVRDAWVLGTIELTYAGKTFRHALPEAYPATVGTEWDVTRVAFPAKDFAPGSGKAVVVARDAAGNSATKEIAIRVDATPPNVAILAPASGEVATDGRITVRLSASDADSAVAPVIDLFVGGARVAELPGPLAEIVVDASTLPSGLTELRAIARDEAGNASAPAVATVSVP